MNIFFFFSKMPTFFFIKGLEIPGKVHCLIYKIFFILFIFFLFQVQWTLD